MYTGTATIHGIIWEVDIATTLEELAQGLIGVASLDPLHGMLFDMGSMQSSISINMDGMLIPIDIVFINEEPSVRMVEMNAQPDEGFTVNFTGTGARYFMEVNAGELIDVVVGDGVVIGGYTPPESSNLMSMMIQMMIVVMMMKMMTSAMSNVG